MLKDYFTFSRGQNRAIIFLLTCMLISSAIYVLRPFVTKDPLPEQADEIKRIMASIQFDQANENGNPAQPPQRLTPFAFDPNTLDSAGFRKLGLREKLVRTLLNYRQKGGHFYNAESLKRIYGLSPGEFEQLEPYIVIRNDENKGANARNNTIVVEINSADTASLVKLRGIGSKLAMNIVQYRNQLGGFVSIFQLKEVYGISPETFAMIRPSVRVNAGALKKINLNEATLAEISRHPYLKGEYAKAIVEYRKKKGYHLEDIGQLKEIELINEEIFRKIAPYITVQ